MFCRASIAVAVGLAVLAPPADAKHRKPMSKSFQVKGTTPYPAPGEQCASDAPASSRHVERLQAPEAGKLAVEVTGFYGDFDIVVTDDRGTVLADGNNESSTSGGSPSDGTVVETLKYTVKRAMAVQILVCNYVASPDATGKYTLTFIR